MNIFKLLFLFFITLSNLFSNEIIIDDTTKSLEILSSSELFIDKSNSLTLSEIKKQDFTKNTRSVLSFGLSPDVTVWIRFKLKNLSKETLEKILVYKNPLTTHVVLFDGNKSYQDGLLQLNENRKNLQPVFPIQLQAEETKTYYLKAFSSVTTLIVKLELLDKEIAQEKRYQHNMILAMFFASMLILALYNLFIYFFTKDRNYLLYVVYMLGVVIHQLLYTGFGAIHFFSPTMIELSIKYAAFVVAFPVLVFALLVSSFLKISQYSKVSFLLKGYLYFFVISLFIVFFIEDLAVYRNLSSLFLLIILFIITLYSALKGNRQAYFVLFGWLVVILAFISMYLSSAGVIEIFKDYKYFVEVALLLEGVIFSIALADKINQLERKKNEASMELVLQKGIETARLENQVKQKTQELKSALDEKSLLLQELNHRVKNNMQTIVSLIRLQSDKCDDEKTIDLLRTIQHRINAMGCLHELLYKQKDITYIDTTKYFELLINELEESFERDDIHIEYEIDTNLPIQTAVYCGLIINELVTNAFKYAFDDKGTIKLRLKSINDEYCLCVEDDGKGYDAENTKENLGSLLIQTLATKQLKGTFQKTTSNGVKVEIKWT